MRAAFAVAAMAAIGAGTPCARGVVVPDPPPAQSPLRTGADAPTGDVVGPPWLSPPLPADAEPLDDAGVALPGELGLSTGLVYRDPSNWLGIPPEKELLNLIRDPLRALDEAYGLAVTGAYTMLFQQSIGPNATTTAAGDLDLFVRWTALGRGTPDTGSFYFAAEYRHSIGSVPPSDLGADVGSLVGTTNGFSDRGWAIKDAYWVQRLANDCIRIGLGRVDPENLVGGYDLQSANTSFLNQAFSTNPTIAFPGSGMGAAIVVRPFDWLSLSAGATNAYGNATTSTIDLLFDEWRLFSFAEVALLTEIPDIGKGRYRASLWNIDPRELSDRPSGNGFSLIADQKVGDDLSLFARYGYADGAALNVRQLLEAGGALQGLFGSPSDLTGLAAAWLQPTGDRPDQYVIEAFHRMQLTGRVQFTVGAQLILEPSNAPDVDALGVLSLRLRTTF